MTLHRLELVPRSDGGRRRRVTLIVERDGAISLNKHEMGAWPSAAWGLDDDEVTLSVSRDQLGRLALALAAEILAGEKDAVGRLAALCAFNDIPCRVARWT